MTIGASLEVWTAGGSKLGFRDQMIRKLPAGCALLPDSNFPDWKDTSLFAAAAIPSRQAPQTTYRVRVLLYYSSRKFLVLITQLFLMFAQ
jgi:hypothetical protein